MKILIVDDNANNRMVLNLLLQDYSEENKTGPYKIDESEDGLDAVTRVKKTQYDLIFMDIMMPKMDGIEATKQIRSENKEVMIIAVSAIDDASKQKEILRNGAEDYVPKPINAEQLFSRLDNYFSLLSLRQKQSSSSNTKSVNLYTPKIFHRQTIFYVENEEALSEFWEYYLLGDEPLKVDNLSDVVRAVYALGDAIVKVSAQPWIIVEADNDAIYFTLNRLEVIGEKLVQLIMLKNSEVTDFKQNTDKMSFRLEKKVSTEVEEAVPHKEAIAVESVVVEAKAATVSEIKQTNTDEYEIFNYMDPDDMDEVEELLGDLSSLMLILGSSELEESEIGQIVAYLESLGRHLSVYSESFTIGQALSQLSMDISLHRDRFQEISGDLSTLSTAFVSDLQSWMKMTFYEGAPSVDFMNDTITANAKIIASMLSQDESVSAEADMDDIFDF